MVVDEESRRWLALEGGRLASEPVLPGRMRLLPLDGVPRDMRRDTGPAGVAHAGRAGLSANGSHTLCREPGKPRPNGAVARGSGSFREAGVNLA